MFVRSVAVVSLVIMFGMLTACAPDPEPSPSAPVFATEAEAFAAAEETYRAYVDALNQVDLSDPATFEAVYGWTTGEALAGAKKSFTQMHADGWVVSGASSFDGFALREFNASSDEELVVAGVCLDVTDVKVVDSFGASQVPPTRRDRQPAELTFAVRPTPTGLAISSSNATDELTCD